MLIDEEVFVYECGVGLYKKGLWRVCGEVGSQCVCIGYVFA